MKTQPAIPESYDDLKSVHLALLDNFETISSELAWLKKQMFGQKAERFIAENNSQTAMDLAGADKEASAIPEATTTVTYERKEKKSEGHGRNVLPAHLERVETIIEPTEDVSEMVKIGEEVTEVLEYNPSKLIVNRIVRPKYAKKDGSGSVVTAALPFRPIDKGLPGPGLLAHVAISKFVDHLPLYRQEKMFKREGVHIPRSTLCGWVEGTYNLLLPLYEKLMEKTLDTDYLQADETTVQVQDDKVPGKTHRGYFFVYHNPLRRSVFFDYRDSRSRNGPLETLTDFRGKLQTDAYSGYNEVLSLHSRVGVGCWAHARRKFIAAKESGSKQADTMLSLIGELYAVEKEAREGAITSQKRLELRKVKSVPIMAGIRKEIDELAQRTLPKSSIGQAVAYTLNIWERLQVYLTDGRVEIDNNLTENALRPVALGRKNWLFAGSADGAERAALIYSLVGTCALNGIEPFEYLKNAIDKLPGYPSQKIAELLPLKSN